MLYIYTDLTHILKTDTPNPPISKSVFLNIAQAKNF